jgi:hypothetical protein
LEARLTDILPEAPLRLDPTSGDKLSLQTGQGEIASDDLPLHGVTQRIDRYLRAAGAEDSALRSRLTAAAARDLLAQGASAEPSWAEIIAAVDRSISSGGARDGGLSVMTSARGRVALQLLGDPVGLPAEWGTPPRHRRVMQAQDLSLWHPRKAIGADRLRRVYFSRKVQAFTACVCWLAVLFVP